MNGRTLRTNNEKSSILMGITRDSILQLAVAEGFAVEVGTITVDELKKAIGSLSLAFVEECPHADCSTATF